MLSIGPDGVPRWTPTGKKGRTPDEYFGEFLMDGTLLPLYRARFKTNSAGILEDVQKEETELERLEREAAEVKARIAKLKSDQAEHNKKVLAEKAETVAHLPNLLK